MGGTTICTYWQIIVLSMRSSCIAPRNPRGSLNSLLRVNRIDCARWQKVENHCTFVVLNQIFINPTFCICSCFLGRRYDNNNGIHFFIFARSWRSRGRAQGTRWRRRRQGWRSVGRRRGCCSTGCRTTTQSPSGTTVLFAALKLVKLHVAPIKTERIFHWERNFETFLKTRKKTWNSLFITWSSKWHNTTLEMAHLHFCFVVVCATFDKDFVWEHFWDRRKYNLSRKKTQFFLVGCI